MACIIIPFRISKTAADCQAEMLNSCRRGQQHPLIQRLVVDACKFYILVLSTATEEAAQGKSRLLCITAVMLIRREKYIVLLFNGMYIPIDLVK